MKTLTQSVVVCIMLLSLPMNLHAWEPNAGDLDKAIKAGDFTEYFTNISAWLNKKVPAKPGGISAAAMKALLKDPVFANALAQRQLIATLGVDKAGSFIRAGETGKEFLDWIMQDTEEGDYNFFSLPGTFMRWLLQNTEAMDLCLEAGGSPSTGSLEVWRRIINADPDSKEGIYLRLAIAVSLSAPSGGSHWLSTPTDPVHRYEMFASAQRNKELLPIFDTLSVWELRKVVCSWASDRELVWARNMLNTWRPDLRENQQVNRIVSEVWRRNSPFSYGLGGFKTVLAGGGKCGGRSWFGTMICQAFGVPSVGMGSPGHACMAFKAADGQWKGAYAPGWEKCRVGVEKTRGPQFLAEVAARSHVTEFSQVQHLQWLASTLTSKENADAVTAIARKIQASPLALKPVRIVVPTRTPSKTEPPFKAEPGVMHVEAEAFSKMSGIMVYNCYTGGKQVNFQKNMNSSWIDYSVDVPASGVYGLTMRVAAPNYKQVLNISSGKDNLATIKIPNTTGLWKTTKEVKLRLKKGTQTLRLSAPYQRGIAVRWFELKSK